MKQQLKLNKIKYRRTFDKVANEACVFIVGVSPVNRLCLLHAHCIQKTFRRTCSTFGRFAGLDKSEVCRVRTQVSQWFC